MRRNGFTLIELLVVIAIIAILAAILSPLFGWGGRGKSPIAGAKTITVMKSQSMSQSNRGMNNYVSDELGITYIVPSIQEYMRLAEGRRYNVQIAENKRQNMPEITWVGSEVLPEGTLRPAESPNPLVPQ